MLCHVYHHAFHNDFHTARDMLLMSHLQESVHGADVGTQILYNRAVVQLGLSAFLPPAEHELPPPPEGEGDNPVEAGDDEVPHLPLESQWATARFDLLSVMGRSRERNVRTWTMQLLQRYRFVIGE